MTLRGNYFRLKKFFLLLVVLSIAITIIDCLRISSYTVCPATPSKELITEEDQIYSELVEGKQIDWARLAPTLEFIGNEYDVSDFKFVNLLRVLYEYPQEIPEEVNDKIERTLLHFRYWWDEPGENSMCYWSENHQILFASAEYLAGQLYLDKTFTNSKLTGRQHVAKAKKRILDWLEMRWKYGFTEFYSGTYYIEDIAALVNLIDFAKDENVRIKCKIILDILLYDVASQQVNGMFVSVSGRAYESNRKGGEHESLGGISKYLLGGRREFSHGLLKGFQLTGNYNPPDVLKEIALNEYTSVVRQVNGMNIADLKREGFGGTDERSIMMQWGMEAFTNAEVVRTSLKHIRKHRMFSNSFLKDFRYLDFTLIRLLRLEPLFVRIINPATNGKAIQQAETYTYKTKKYSLYSVQDYFQQQYADQHHTAGMNIGNHFSVFHSHPARDLATRSHSPNYWVGYGRLPHVRQQQQVSMAIYNLPLKKNLTEPVLLDYTHAYFPSEKFDRFRITRNYAFGEKDGIYIALIGRNTFSFRPGSSDDLIQKGRKAFWIIEAGDNRQYPSFEHFINHILKSSLVFSEKKIELHYSGHTLVYGNIEKQKKRARFISGYMKQHKGQYRKIALNEKTLLLDFYKKKELN